MKAWAKYIIRGLQTNPKLALQTTDNVLGFTRVLGSDQELFDFAHFDFLGLRPSRLCYFKEYIQNVGYEKWFWFYAKTKCPLLTLACLGHSAQISFLVELVLDGG